MLCIPDLGGSTDLPALAGTASPEGERASGRGEPWNSRPVAPAGKSGDGGLSENELYITDYLKRPYVYYTPSVGRPRSADGVPRPGETAELRPQGPRRTHAHRYSAWRNGR